jgi:hypothetical protein
LNLIVEDLSVFHHEFNRLQLVHIVQRIAGYCHDVGLGSESYHAQFAWHLQQLSRAGDCGLKGRHGRHAVFDHASEFMDDRMFQLEAAQSVPEAILNPALIAFLKETM